MFAMTTSNGYELVQHPTFILLRRLSVPTANGPDHFDPSRQANVSNHLLPPQHG